MSTDIVVTKVVLATMGTRTWCCNDHYFERTMARRGTDRSGKSRLGLLSKSESVNFTEK